MNYDVITLSSETISRKTDIWVEPPTLKHFFRRPRGEMYAQSHCAV